jgi:hypothetical protein
VVWWRCSDSELSAFYVLFFIKLYTSEVRIAGVSAHPNEVWMMQVARNVTMEEWGFLEPSQYLVHDRDRKFCAASQRLLDDAGVKRAPLPPRLPWLNPYTAYCTSLVRLATNRWRLPAAAPVASHI